MAVQSKPLASVLQQESVLSSNRMDYGVSCMLSRLASCQAGTRISHCPYLPLLAVQLSMYTIMNYCNHYNWHTLWLRLGQYLSSSAGKFTELEGGKPQSNISLAFSISLAAAAAPAVSSYSEDNSPSSTDIVNQFCCTKCFGGRFH